MALTILDNSMTSDRSAHAGRLVPGARHTWEVSWLPGRHLNRSEAVTAMTIADMTANGDIRPGHRAWPHIENWAAELRMTGPEALDRVAAPPQWARNPDKIYEFPEVNGIRLAIEDPDPIDLGTADLYDYFELPAFEGTEDDPIDLTWTGKEPPEPAPPDPGPPRLESEDTDRGQAESNPWLPVPKQRGAWERPAVFIPCQGTSWLDDRAPRQAGNPGRSPLHGPEPDTQEQPAPDNALDWEAGE